MNNLVYFYEELTIDEAVNQDGSDSESVSKPERVPYVVRDTMEELAYRTAIWYNQQGEAVMHYRMTTTGIKVRVINDEDYQRDDDVERLPVSGEEPRLLG